MPAASKINPDLEEERKKVAFKVEEFTNWYHGGADKVADKRFLGERREIISNCDKLSEV